MIIIIGVVRRVSLDDVQPRRTLHTVVKMDADSMAGLMRFKVNLRDLPG